MTSMFLRHLSFFKNTDLLCRPDVSSLSFIFPSVGFSKTLFLKNSMSTFTNAASYLIECVSTSCYANPVGTYLASCQVFPFQIFTLN